MKKDTHEEFVDACLEYIKCYERFIYNNSDQAGIRARNFLQDIKKLVKIRRDEIQAERKKRRAARIGMRGKRLKITKRV